MLSSLASLNKEAACGVTHEILVAMTTASCLLSHTIQFHREDDDATSNEGEQSEHKGRFCAHFMITELEAAGKQVSGWKLLPQMSDEVKANSTRQVAGKEIGDQFPAGCM